MDKWSLRLLPDKAPAHNRQVWAVKLPEDLVAQLCDDNAPTPTVRMDSARRGVLALGNKEVNMQMHPGDNFWFCYDQVGSTCKKIGSISGKISVTVPPPPPVTVQASNKVKQRSSRDADHQNGRMSKPKERLTDPATVRRRPPSPSDSPAEKLRNPKPKTNTGSLRKDSSSSERLPTPSSSKAKRKSEKAAVSGQKAKRPRSTPLSSPSPDSSAGKRSVGEKRATLTTNASKTASGKKPSSSGSPLPAKPVGPSSSPCLGTPSRGYWTDVIQRLALGPVSLERLQSSLKAKEDRLARILKNVATHNHLTYTLKPAYWTLVDSEHHSFTPAQKQEVKDFKARVLEEREKQDLYSKKELTDLLLKYKDKDAADRKAAIKSIDDYEEYRNEFKEKFKLYQTLNIRLEETSVMFENLRHQYMFSVDEKERTETQNKIEKEYKARKPSHGQMCTLQKILHDELAILKGLVQAYVNQAAAKE